MSKLFWTIIWLMILVYAIFLFLSDDSNNLYGQTLKPNDLTLNYDFKVDNKFIDEYYLENTFNAKSISYRLGLGLKLNPLKFWKVFKTDISFIGYTGFDSEDVFNPSVRWRLKLWDFNTTYFFKQYFNTRSIFEPRIEHKLSVGFDGFDVSTTIRDTEYDVYLNIPIDLSGRKQ